MKIVVVPNVWSRGGGLEIVTRDIVQALCNFGHEVVIMPAWGGGEDGLWNGDMRDLRPGFATVKYYQPHNRILKSLWFRHFKFPILAKKIEGELKDGGLLILGHVHLTPIVDYMKRPEIIRKWVWTHGDEVWGDLAVKWSKWLNKLDHVISVSDDTRGHLLRGGVTVPVTTIHNSIDTERFVPTSTPERIRCDEVMICSRIPHNFEYKGHVRLMDAIRRAEEMLGCPVRLRIVGGGAGLERLKALVAERGQTDRVTVAGRVSDEELVEAYQHCGVYCMPSDNEGFGLVYAEAEACARPVVVSTIGGAPETMIPDKTGILADPFDIEANAKAIAAIMADRVKADEMGRQGHEFVSENFSFDAFCTNIARVLDICCRTMADKQASYAGKT